MSAQDGIPSRFTLMPDGYHVDYAGTAEDGRKFFVTQPFEPGKNEYIATFFWKADGSYDSIDVQEFGPRETLDDEARTTAMAQHLSNLGDYVLEEISVEPFSEEAFGTSFGFIPQVYEGTVSVNLMPGDFMAFYEPWDSGEYDT